MHGASRITRSQWWVLAFISRKDGLPQSQLADELDVGKVALGALIDRLEIAGFVTRKTAPALSRRSSMEVVARAQTADCTLLDRGKPRVENTEGGSQSANKSLINRRLSLRSQPCADCAFLTDGHQAARMINHASALDPEHKSP